MYNKTYTILFNRPFNKDTYSTIPKIGHGFSLFELNVFKKTEKVYL